MKRLLSLLLALSLALAILTGCGGKEPAQEDADTGNAGNTSEITGTPEEPPETPVYTGPINPLTGEAAEEGLAAKRPYAVMLNNIRAAQPQFGISQADIIYEVVAEGGITRMLALYQDLSGVESLGSIRSARHYYLDIAQGHDAIYVHAGGSPQAYNALANRGVKSVDGIKGQYGALFYRDAARKANNGYEHSLFLHVADTVSYVEEKMEPSHAPGYSESLTFTPDGTPAGGSDANTITVRHSSYKTGVFEYSEEQGCYLVSQYDAPYTDGANNEQVAVENVLVLFCSITPIPGDTAGRMDSALSGGSGQGYFACGGKAVEINWAKESYDAPILYTLADGSPLSLGVGKSYINIVELGASVTVE